MPIIVNSNVSSLVAQNTLSKMNSGLNKTLQQLSTGLRINSAKDDAAGMAISVGFTTQIRGGAKARDNIQDGLNLMSTTEGGMVTTTEHLARIRDLCLQAANEVNNVQNKSAMVLEIKQRLDDIDVQARALNFNGIQLLDGTTSALRLQIGTGTDADLNSIDIASVLTNMRVSGGGLNISLNVTVGAASGSSISVADWDHAAIMAYIDQIDSATTQILSDRSELGAYMSRLGGVYDNLLVVNDNLTQANSRVKDVDYAQGSSDMVKYQILQQVTMSVLSQANQMPQLALQLLQ